MNKAKITYRFTQNRSGNEQQEKRDEHAESGREHAKPGNVISLNRDEYRIEPVTKEETPTSKSLFDRDPLNPFTTDFGAWTSPFDETETDRVERIIRQSTGTVGETGYYDGRPNSATEMGNGQGSELLTQPFDTSPSNDYIRPTRTRQPWLKMISSVAAAIATGAVFGFFVLSLFSGEHDSIESTASNLLKLPNFSVSEKDKSTAIAQTPGAEEVNKQQMNAANNAAKSQEEINAGKDRASAPVVANVSSSLQVNIPAKTYTMIQNGVFSNMQGAQSLQNDMKKKGYPSAVENAEKIYVYLGLAVNRSDALALSQKLQQNKMEVYMKTYTLPPVNKIVWGGPPSQAAETYFALGDKLVKQLSGLTMSHLNEPGSSAPDQALLKTIKEAHQSLSTAGASFNEGLANEAKSILQKMNNAMNTAVLSVEQYAKNASDSYLWQAQQSLLQYTLAEKELLTAISAQ